MEILEKDGKYYLQLLNGELELTEAQVKARLQKGAVIRNNLDSWIDNFTYRHWVANAVPTKGEEFIRSATFFDDIIREFEKIYEAAANKAAIGEKMMTFCWARVQELKKEKEHATDDRQKIFADYHILCWFRILSYLQALTHIYTPLF